MTLDLLSPLLTSLILLIVKYASPLCSPDIVCCNTKTLSPTCGVRFKLTFCSVVFVPTITSDALSTVTPYINASLPFAPAGPVDPVSPLGPSGPCGPTGPSGPAGPVDPVSPLGPCAPVAPTGP